MAEKEITGKQHDKLFKLFLNTVCTPTGCPLWPECRGKDPEYCEFWTEFQHSDRKILTKREKDMLLLWEEGLGTKEISKMFNCSERTVEREIKRALSILTTSS